MVSAYLFLGLAFGAVSVSADSHHGHAVKLSAESNPGVTDPQGKACYYLHDLDYPGYDVGNKPAKDYHDCTKICGDFKGCVTWSWTKHGGGTCWLKSKAPKGVDSKGSIALGCEKFPDNAKSAMRTHSKKSGSTHVTIKVHQSNPSVKLSAESNPGVTDPQGRACHYLHDIDYPGYDVGNKPSKDYHDCTKICGDFKGCVTWSWSKHNGGTCWLKSKAPKGVDSKGTVVLGCEKFPANAKRAMKTHGKKSHSNPSVKLSAESNPGVTDPQGKACHYLHDIDYPGYDVGNKPSKDYHDCTKICGDFKGCVTWSWSKHNGGTCWLKSKAPKGVDSKGTVVLGCEKFPANAKRAMKTHGKKSGSTHVTIKIHQSNPSVKLSAESNPGVTDPQGRACHYLHDIDYPGYDVGNKPSKDYHDCTKICGDFKGCVTWSWSKHNGGTCWLKSKAPKGVDSKGTVVLGCEKFPQRA